MSFVSQKLGNLISKPDAPADREKECAPETFTRRPVVNVLFFHREPGEVDRCLQELKRVGFTVNSDIIENPEQLDDRLRSGVFDLVVSQYITEDAGSLHLTDLQRKLLLDVPLIVIGDRISREEAAALTLQGAFDLVEPQSIGHLPVAIRRVLNEKCLRHDRDRAEKELRRLEARYRALAGNLSYGICRCSPEGWFLDVNQALVTMLGYPTRSELLAVNVASNVVSDPIKRAQLLGQSNNEGLVDPVEVDWARKDGTSLKVRLSAQEVLNDQGHLEAYEVIVEDITKQRELEDHLRRLAASDPLTGLANYRHLIDALDMEIRRSMRTGREFALLLFDLDGLKQINDTYGHVTGSHAICRMADALTLFCRDIDTAARFGGDEFALLLPETGAEAANSVARRIRNSIADDRNGPRLSVSVGTSVYPRDGDTVENLVSTADTAMYAMKRNQKAEHPPEV